jgi:hypothetical protein
MVLAMRKYLPILLLILLTGCRDEARFQLRHPPADFEFGDREMLGLLAEDAIDEASGLAASRLNPGVLWTHNDSGDKPRLFALNAKGAHLGIYDLLGAEARDWEDMAIGPGPKPGRHYLYVADCGDNKARHDIKTIYRLPEPRLRPDQIAIESALSGVEAIRFRYPNGPRDAETLLVDPATADIYIVSKREQSVHLYRAAFPQSTSSVITLESLGKLALTDVTAGDVSADANEILIKTYGTVLYWQRLPDQDLGEALLGKPSRLPYYPEPQGESIAWQAEGKGYFTLSEERDGIPAMLYFYPRLEP